MSDTIQEIKSTINSKQDELYSVKKESRKEGLDMSQIEDIQSVLAKPLLSQSDVSNENILETGLGTSQTTKLDIAAIGEVEEPLVLNKAN